MVQGESDRNLLFGVLALQMDFITRDALLAAINAWVLAKDKPLGRILVEHGDLDERGFGLLDPVVGEHVQRHGDEPDRSLESLTSVSWLRRDLEVIADPVLHASVSRMGAARAGTGDPMETATPSVGDSSFDRSAIPHPPPARPRRAGRGLHRPRRGAQPRGGAETNSGRLRRPRREPIAVPPGGGGHRRRWNTRGSSRSTAWVITPTAGRSTPCG